MKVLISAYACEPNKGSEPGVGWNWVEQISKFAEVWVITRKNNRDNIEDYLTEKSNLSCHFVYIDLPKWIMFWKRKEKGVHLYYFLWQIVVFFKACRLNRESNFDIVHHLTFGNIWLPLFTPLLGSDFIWGPVGGGEHISKVFMKGHSAFSKAEEFLRKFIICSLRFNVLFQYTCRKAKIIISKTEDTANKIPRSCRSKVIIFTDVGIKEVGNKKFYNTEKRQSINILCIGTLKYWRGFDLAIKAFSRALKIDDNLDLYIIGKGPDKKRLIDLCLKENVTDKVNFIGQIKEEKLVDYFSNSSIFLNPCLKEGGVTVLLEAMSLGLPVICMDTGGVTRYINKRNGIKIELTNPEQTIKDLTTAILTLAKNPKLRVEMAKKAKKTIGRYFYWEKKRKEIKKMFGKLESKDSVC